MNCVVVTGTVLAAPEMQERTGERVWNFRMAIDTRAGKRATEVTISCWRDVGRFLAQYLSIGDRVTVTGSLSHMLGRGVVVIANQLARLGEELSINSEQRAQDADEPGDLEKTWTHHLDLGTPGPRR